VSRVRTADPADAPAIAGLVNRAYRVEDFFIDGDRTDETEVGAKMATGRWLVLEEDGALVGCVYVEITGDRVYFGPLAIDPARQGGGRGRTLIDAVAGLGRAAGARHLDLTVVSVRAELVPFYQRLGFRPVGTSPFPDTDKLKQPVHFVHYTRPIETGEP
jgi:N-acetylglutamate synthase-like GNAT family acetyltransferase